MLVTKVTYSAFNKNIVISYDQLLFELHGHLCNYISLINSLKTELVLEFTCDLKATKQTPPPNKI